MNNSALLSIRTVFCDGRLFMNTNREEISYVNMNDKLKEVCDLFRIEGAYVGYETIQMGNVNKTYEVKFILMDGSPKSFLVQNVNTYAFRHPVELMENIDKVTEHIRAKKPGQVALHFHHTADRKTYVIDGKNFWRMTNYIPSVTHNAVMNPEQRFHGIHPNRAEL